MCGSPARAVAVTCDATRIVGGYKVSQLGPFGYSLVVWAVAHYMPIIMQMMEHTWRERIVH